jgi:uncharacterized membrane protein
MIPLPNPLHPAIVHFPIVLLLLGSMAAVLAAFTPRWHLPWLTALMLAAGAMGAALATRTGNQQAEMAGDISQRAEALLDEHEEWAERTRTLAFAAAILALTAASLAHFPKTARALRSATALMAVAAAFSVAKTGHYGGQLVYKHGVGINPAAGGQADLSPGKNRAE